MRHLLSILDLTIQEIDGLLASAEDILDHPDKYSEACRGKVLAALFFEPSTRTRLSFESAMLGLGGKTLGFHDASTSSTRKGESVADTISVVSGYADIIAMRHPKEGAPLVASQHSRVPIINAGDGGHHHPTQTLTDLLTIHRELGHFENLTIGLCGDLKFGRTVHSLMEAMSRYAGVKFILISPKELAVPPVMLEELEKKGIPYLECEGLEEHMGELDILYMTRIQGERFESREEYLRLKDSYVLTPEKLAAAKEKMLVLHPLPRVNEIDPRVDKDPRAAYFREAFYGRYVRMALILKLLRERGEGPVSPDKGHPHYPESQLPGAVCQNPHCITTTEQGLEQIFRKDEESGEHRCFYCESKAE